MRIFKELENVIRDRDSEPSTYTGRLLTEGTLVERKVSEEAYELIESAFKKERESIIFEACDLFYHTLVLLRKYGISLEEIESELTERRKK